MAAISAQTTKQYWQFLLALITIFEILLVILSGFFLGATVWMLSSLREALHDLLQKHEGLTWIFYGCEFVAIVVVIGIFLFMLLSLMRLLIGIFLKCTAVLERWSNGRRFLFWILFGCVGLGLYYQPKAIVWAYLIPSLVYSIVTPGFIRMYCMKYLELKPVCACGCNSRRMSKNSGCEDCKV